MTEILVSSVLVAHYKFHIIPRFKNDKIVIDWAREDVGLRERAVFAREINEELIFNGSNS